MNAKLEAIAKQAAWNLQALIAEGADDIAEAWAGCAREAKLQEAKPKFRLAFSITLDLDAQKAEYDLTYGVRRRLSVVATIPDPLQTTMALDTETTVTLRTDTGSVTAPRPVLRVSVAELRRQKQAGA